MQGHIKTTHEILDSLEEELSIDTTREYVTGLSMGGECTWMSLIERPERFAAGVPICAGDRFIGMSARELGKKFAQFPLWLFHGDADDVISVDVSRALVTALKDAGGRPKYTEYPGVDHGSWDLAYRDPALIEWLFAQRRGAPVVEQERARPVSPTVHADRTVTFRMDAPGADEVVVYTQFTDGSQAMEKDETGVWSVTLGPADPGIYVYGFAVDDVAMSDPNNKLVLVNQWPDRSLVEIPDDGQRYFDQRPVAHGEIRINWIESETLGVNRKFYVYTPPGYDKNKKKYPIVYLSHGGGGYEFIWTDMGRVNLVLDNLIADKKAVPMIVVMPFGHTRVSRGSNIGRSLGSDSRRISSMTLFRISRRNIV